MRSWEKFWLTGTIALFALLHVSGTIIMAKPHQAHGDAQIMIPANAD